MKRRVFIRVRDYILRQIKSDDRPDPRRAFWAGEAASREQPEINCLFAHFNAENVKSLACWNLVVAFAAIERDVRSVNFR